MRRRYQRELYAERVAMIKELMPECCIGVDVIVGFPGETKEHFLETYEFLNGLDVSYLHVFTYSERANTHAIGLDGIVNGSERAERSKMLHILSEKKRRHFYEQHVGKTFPVLWEAERDGEMMHGFTSNYIKASTVFQPGLINTITMAKLGTTGTDGTVKVEIAETAAVI